MDVCKCKKCLDTCLDIQTGVRMLRQVSGHIQTSAKCLGPCMDGCSDVCLYIGRHLQSVWNVTRQHDRHADLDECLTLSVQISEHV